MLRTEQRGQKPQIAIVGALEITGSALNISAGGMRLLSSDPLAEGVEITVTFPLPDDSEKIVCGARVIWCRSLKGNPRLHEVGLNFNKISDDDRRRVQAFVDASLGPVMAEG